MTDLPSRQLIAAVRPIVDAVGATLVPPDQIEPSDVPLMWDGAHRRRGAHAAAARRARPAHRRGRGRARRPAPAAGREDKQRAVRLLDERGAFTLRRAVEQVADAMGVSRITVYNYLNAIHRP